MIYEKDTAQTGDIENVKDTFSDIHIELIITNEGEDNGINNNDINGDNNRSNHSGNYGDADNSVEKR